MYSGPSEAFLALVNGKHKEAGGLPWRITNLTSEGAVVRNGISYCFAEVTFANGVQYGISAYGEEATDLYRVASMMKHEEGLVLVAPQLA